MGVADRAEALARDLLVPRAQAVDGEGIPRSHLDALGAAGLLGIEDPESGVTPAERRRVHEAIGGACGTTWFCFAQHHSPLRAVAASPHEEVRARWREPLRTGSALAGVAVAHLRRPGAPAVVARQTAQGWVLDGRLDWVTTWAIADVVMVVAQAVDEGGAELDELVQVLITRETPGVAAGAPLALAAMGGTWTCPVTLTEVECVGDRVVGVLDRARWREDDALRTANAQPAVFGLARAALDDLGRLPGAAAEVAGALGEELAAVRARAYELLDEVPAAQGLDERLRLRALGLDLAMRSATALVTARAGRAVMLGDPAQRRVREAMFHLVQAQTAGSRQATLALLAGQGGE